MYDCQNGRRHSFGSFREQGRPQPTERLKLQDTPLLHHNSDICNVQLARGVIYVQ